MLKRGPHFAMTHPRRVPTVLCSLALVLPLLAATAPRASADPTVLLGRNGVGEYQGVRGEGFLAWQQNTTQHPGQYDIFARPLEGGDRFQVNAEGTKGANGDIEGDLLVYQEFEGQNSDLSFFDLVDRVRSSPPSGINTRHWEYWPSMSGRWLLFGRLLSNGDRKIILFDLTTGDSQNLDQVTREGSFGAPGQVNGNWAVWYTCTPDAECDVVLYHIPDGATETIPNPGPRQRSPSVTPDGTVYFARSRRGCGNDVRLLRYPPGGPRTVFWRLPANHDVGSTRAYVDEQGDVTFYFDDFVCGRPARSDVWELVERAPRQLEVDVDGRGTITSSPAGIDCGEDCDETYGHGTAVTLTATPDEDSTFTRWEGDCSGGESTCTVTMDESRSVTATFGTRPRLTVTVGGSGQGDVAGPGINCPGDCSQLYDLGTDVTLTASAGQDSEFAGWGGACSGTSSTCQLAMNQSRSVTATFSANPVLTVDLAGAGQGSVTGPGIDCPEDCTQAYAGGNVTLDAAPDALSTFAGWSGDCSGASCTVTMNQSRSVTATFEPLVVDPILWVRRLR